MKIRKLTLDGYPKAAGLLRQAFPSSNKELQLVEALHKNGTQIHEWVCIHINRAIAYIAFTKAYNGAQVCGLHLGPMAVKPEFQRQGVGSELMRFAMRQEVIKQQTIYVFGRPRFFQRFGFASCAMPICPFAKNNGKFSSIRNPDGSDFTLGYEAEFGARVSGPS